MHPLDTHDTARFRTNAAPGAVPVALGLSIALPGIPVLFAGDEFGLVGNDGEDSRTPMPWGTETDDDVAETLALYRRLIALKRDHPSLNGGGIRWLHASDDALAFVRDTDDESVLVVADSSGRAARSGRRASGCRGARRGQRRRGRVAGSRPRGPAFLAWKLPGVGAPAWA